MKYDKDSVIISDSLNGLGTDIYKEYLSHALCLGGACKFCLLYTSPSPRDS